MGTQDLLNAVLIIGFLIIVVCIGFVTFFLVQTLKAVSKLAESLENTTQDVREKIQMKALRMVPALLLALVSRIFKRGR
ncbi:hypothetical protein HYU93_03735 [Candidatus Daviesbacteria bacterium]|nr:hypothetical protein [Candidatus Daviesbacteria bacterium]